MHLLWQDIEKDVTKCLFCGNSFPRVQLQKLGCQILSVGGEGEFGECLPQSLGRMRLELICNRRTSTC